MATYTAINLLPKPVDLSVPGTTYQVVVPAATVDPQSGFRTRGTATVQQAHLDAINALPSTHTAQQSLALVSLMDNTNPNLAQALAPSVFDTQVSRLGFNNGSAH